MKKLIALSLCTLVAASVQAMPMGKGPCNGGHEERKNRGPNIEQMQQKMALSDEQATALEKVFTEQQAKRQALHQQHCEQIQQHQEEGYNRIASILTAEQMTQFDAAREARQEKRQQKREARRTPQE